MAKRRNLLPATTGPALPPEVEAQAHQARVQAVEVASRAVPNVLKAVIARAKEGDPGAARLILEIVGIVRRGGSGIVIAVQNVAPRQYDAELDGIWRRWRELGIAEEAPEPKPKRGVEDAIDI